MDDIFLIELINEDFVNVELQNSLETNIVELDNSGDSFYVEINEIGAPGKDGIGGGVSSVNNILPVSGNVTITASDISGFSTVATTGDYSDLSNTPNLSLYQLLLVSGTNIKTINGSSILGSGDLILSTGNEHEYDVHSTDSSIKYIGIASIGTLTSQTGWTITKIVVSVNGNTTVTHATGIYDNRESLIYS